MITFFSLNLLNGQSKNSFWCEKVEILTIYYKRLNSEKLSLKYKSLKLHISNPRNSFFCCYLSHLSNKGVLIYAISR